MGLRPVRRPVVEAARPRVDGKFLAIGDQRIWIKGVTYGSFAPNGQGEPFPEFAVLKEDFARMREAGINTVRLYAPPSDRIADAAADAGLYLIPDICWGIRGCDLDYPRVVKLMFDWASQHARRLRDHPAILMYSIGNEIPPLVVRWYKRERMAEFLREIHDRVKTQAPDALVTYVNHPPTEFMLLPFLDVVSFNVYLHGEKDFRDYLARLHSLAGDRPVFLAELGLDSAAHGQEAQAEFLRSHLRAVFEKGLCGAAVYSWTDEWKIYDNSIEGWSFGVTAVDRTPKSALAAVRDIYSTNLYSLGAKPWPKVTVVVATYNGAETLAKCLQSLTRLRYPNYEVIVVDDGSTDATPGIARSHAVRYVRMAMNSGLSNARNGGVQAATGEIVAFIDDDAYADRDWLFFMVSALQELGAAAVGGPNLSPPDEGFIAQCVDHAPGNPTHVLLGDELAEHVPGCNMAYLKAALEAIGGFDATHRAAGDDVDVCWRLLVRDWKIAFSASAVVWHRRRPTVRRYRRQQIGYGYAEAHLQRAYPGRFNVFGGGVWRGRIYHQAVGWRVDFLPRVFKPRIYHGSFGAAPFQSLYQPALTPWFQNATSVEWQIISWIFLVSGALAGVFGPRWAAYTLVPLGALLQFAFAFCALSAGFHAQKQRRWKGLRALLGPLIVSHLHMAQPLARAWGRVLGWWHLRDQPGDYPAVERVWGNLGQRHVWLRHLCDHLNDCGWVAHPATEWDDFDIEISGPGPFRATLEATAEENLEKGTHWVRYRIRSYAKPRAWIAVAATAAGLGSLAFAPSLALLGLPLLHLLRVGLGGRKHLEQAISQCALESAAALHMPRVDRQYQW